MNLSTILLQAKPGMNPAMQQMIMIGMIVVVFYFFMIRPQMKKAKQEKTFKESLNKGDKVVTIGGIHGKIIEVNDTTFIIEIDNNVKVKIEKSAVSADATKQYQQPEAKKIS
jgi:preprotein translocase subunit YajC